MCDLPVIRHFFVTGLFNFEKKTVIITKNIIVQKYTYKNRIF